MSACWMALMVMLVMLQVMLMTRSRRHRHRVSSLDVATQNTDSSVLATLADLERRRAPFRSLGASRYQPHSKASQQMSAAELCIQR